VLQLKNEKKHSVSGRDWQEKNRKAFNHCFTADTQGLVNQKPNFSVVVEVSGKAQFSARTKTALKTYTELKPLEKYSLTLEVIFLNSPLGSNFDPLEKSLPLGVKLITVIKVDL
jgi:hypothetical protein